MSLIEILSVLVGIPSGVITIIKAWNEYIKSRKDSKKDPSAASKRSDGSVDNLNK